MKLEDFTTGTGQKLKVHAKATCEGEYCVIHNPSNHRMRDFPTYWRNDRHIMERICPHGVGHPDPDDIAYVARRLTPRQAEGHSIHGCDGCCCEITQHLDDVLPDSLGG